MQVILLSCIRNYSKILHLNWNSIIHILSLGSDSTIVELQAQKNILNSPNTERFSIYNSTLNIYFSCPIFESIGYIISVQDPKHAKKIARNAIMSSARLLSFENLSIYYDHLLEQVNHYNSIMYKNDIIKLGSLRR